MVTHTYHLNLIADAQSGNSSCLNSLAILVKQKIYPYLCRTNIHFDVVDDLLQETQLEMVRSIHNLREPEKFWGWIHRVTRSKMQKHFRLTYKENNRYLDRRRVDEYEIPDNNTKDIFSHLISEEDEVEVNTAILQLKSDYREIIYLRYFERKSYVEIASLLNYSQMQARVKLHRARKELKKHLVANPDIMEF